MDANVYWESQLTLLLARPVQLNQVRVHYILLTPCYALKKDIIFLYITDELKDYPTESVEFWALVFGTWLLMALLSLL